MKKRKTGMCRACYLKNMPTGIEHPHWKGGVIIHNMGYRLIYMPEHPFCKGNGYIFEHRLVMEKHLGRYLKPEEIVHHLNSIKDDNRIENLVITDVSEHAKHYDAHGAPKIEHCSLCPEEHLARGFCKSHYWTEYLQEARKTNGYNERSKVRAREYRAKRQVE